MEKEKKGIYNQDNNNTANSNNRLIHNLIISAAILSPNLFKNLNAYVSSPPISIWESLHQNSTENQHQDNGDDIIIINISVLII